MVKFSALIRPLINLILFSAQSSVDKPAPGMCALTGIVDYNKVTW